MIISYIIYLETTPENILSIMRDEIAKMFNSIARSYNNYHFSVLL